MILGSAKEDADEGWSAVSVVNPVSDVEDKSHFVKGKHVSGLGVVDTDVKWTVTIVVGSLSDIVDEVYVNEDKEVTGSGVVVDTDVIWSVIIVPGSLFGTECKSHIDIGKNFVESRTGIQM